MLFKYELGEEVEDVITGYVGSIVTRMDHVTGCATYLVQRKYKKGEKIESSEHFDETRLKATGKKVKLDMPVKKDTGAMALPKSIKDKK